MYVPQNIKTNIRAIDRIQIEDFLSHFLQMSGPFGVKMRNRGEADVIREQINLQNNPQFWHIKSIDGHSYWSNQKVDFVESNLGAERGVIFYFLCNSCNRRTKYLYFLSYTREPLCRICYNLKYNQPNRKTRSLSRILHKPFPSTEDKYKIMKKIDPTKEDIKNYLSDNCKNN